MASLSNFPRRIALFPTHRDLLDVVEAQAVNNIQSELTAVQTSLGTNPHIYNDVAVDPQNPTGVVIDEGGEVTDDTLLYNSITYRYYNSKVTPVDHGTVGQRMDDIERGQQNHCFAIAANNFAIRDWPVGTSNKPLGIRFPKPPVNRDPFKYWNGYGVTLRKGGYWVFKGSIGVALQTTNGTSDGVYLGAIDFDGNYLEGMDKQRVTGTAIQPILNPSIEGWFNPGTKIALRVAQHSGRGQRVTFARLAGHLVREGVGT